MWVTIAIRVFGGPEKNPCIHWQSSFKQAIFAPEISNGWEHGNGRLRKGVAEENQVKSCLNTRIFIVDLPEGW